MPIPYWITALIAVLEANASAVDRLLEIASTPESKCNEVEKRIQRLLVLMLDDVVQLAEIADKPLDRLLAWLRREMGGGSR